MKVRVSKRQFNILIDNLKLIGDKGLYLKMCGRIAKDIIDEHSTENKTFIVNFSLNGYKSQIKIYSNNNSRARKLASEILPHAKIFNAKEVK